MVQLVEPVIQWKKPGQWKEQMRTKEGDLFGNVPMMIIDCLHINNTSTENLKQNKIAELFLFRFKPQYLGIDH